MWLELRGVRRHRWWSGRRLLPLYLALLFLLALLGATLGISAAIWIAPDVRGSAWEVGPIAAVCPANGLAALLGFALPWIVPAIAASTIVREREIGTWDLLRTTLLSERGIVLGKLGGCLGRLWPGLLALALLAPFQVVWNVMIQAVTMGSMSAILADFTAGAEWSRWPALLGLVLIGLVAQLLPWSHLALHTAAGLLASARSRSSTTAIACAYGGVILLRAGLWLVDVSITAVITPLALSLTSTTWDASYLNLGRSLAMAFKTLATVAIEVAIAAALIWAAVWWLKRA